MIEIFTDSDFTVVGYLKSELEGAGIAAFIKNQDATHSMIGAPVPLFWPKLCVTRDEDVEKAKEIVARFVAARNTPATSDEVDWKCPKCGAVIPGSFELCWNCDDSGNLRAG